MLVTLEAFDPIGGLRARYRSNGQGDGPPEKGLTDWHVQYKLGPPVDISFAYRAEISRIVDSTQNSDYGIKSLVHAFAQSPHSSP
jgi:hypothetical protein